MNTLYAWWEVNWKDALIYFILITAPIMFVMNGVLLIYGYWIIKHLPQHGLM